MTYPRARVFVVVALISLSYDGRAQQAALVIAGFVRDRLTISRSDLRDEVLEVSLSRAAVIAGQSINIGRADVTDVPFDFGITNQTIKGAEIVISNAGGTIAGHVTDARSMPIADYSVIVFSTDRTKWFANSRFLKFGRPAQDGGFEIVGLPAGEYWVAAVDTIQGNQAHGEWEKPDVLDVLSTRATRVMLSERERYMTVLRLIRR